ncbi:TPA: YtcA family lipoprotein [Serratia marcescens]
MVDFMAIKIFCMAVVVMLLNGCHSHAPSVNILGAYFPDWLFCISGGCFSVVLIYSLLSARKKEGWLSPYVLTYPLLISLFSIVYWAVFFN